MIRQPGNVMTTTDAFEVDSVAAARRFSMDAPLRLKSTPKLYPNGVNFVDF
jgi:hypothetical protein